MSIMIRAILDRYEIAMIRIMNFDDLIRLVLLPCHVVGDRCHFVEIGMAAACKT